MPVFRPAKQLIHSSINGLLYPCEVAEIEPHGLVARYQAGQIYDGWPKFNYGKVEPNSHTMTPGWNATTPDDIGMFFAVRNRDRVMVHRAFLRDPLKGEQQAAERHAPAIVAMLRGSGLMRPADDLGWPIPPELGPIHRARVKSGWPGDVIEVGLDELVPSLERFVAGDCGDYGQLSREPIEDPATLWALDLADRATRNRDAASTGEGLVCGKYPLPGERFLWVLQRLTRRGGRETAIGVWQKGITIISE